MFVLVLVALVLVLVLVHVLDTHLMIVFWIIYNLIKGESQVKGISCGLDIQKKGKYMYLSKVEHPAPSHNLHVGDRVIALNGKKIEKYKSTSDMVKKMTNNNVVRLVVDPTMLTK